jgi:threonine dehydratase
MPRYLDGAVTVTDAKVLAAMRVAPADYRALVEPGAADALAAVLSGKVHCRDRNVAASLASSTRFIELDAATWSTNTVRVMARNVSGSACDLGAATLSVAVTKRRIP